MSSTIRHRLNWIARGPTLSGIYAALHVDGVERVKLIYPCADLIISLPQASYCDGIAIENGDTNA